MEKCVVCNNACEEHTMRHIHIKDKPKKICEECIAAIKGIV